MAPRSVSDGGSFGSAARPHSTQPFVDRGPYTTYELLFHGDVDAESARLKETLTLAFGMLSDMRFLVGTLDLLARRDVARGLSEQHCRAIAQSLIWAIERRMGAAFTRQVCNAWIAFLAVVMTCLHGSVAGLSRRAA